MTRSTSDYFVFYHHKSLGQCIHLIVYVDDIVITSSDQNGIQKLKQHLFSHIQTKDLRKLKYSLRIEIVQSNSDVVMSQRKYVLDKLEENWYVRLSTCRHSYGPEHQACVGTREASTRSREISTTCGETELPHHDSTKHFLSCECS